MSVARCRRLARADRLCGPATNLLATRAALKLVAPTRVTPRRARVQFTLEVDDLDATGERLQGR